MKPENDLPSRGYCSHCQAGFNYAKNGNVCPLCGKEIPETIDQDVRTPLVQALHRKANEYGDKRDGAMSFLVLGAIFLIVGIIFITLSYKPISATNTNKAIRPDSLEFVISMLGIVLGGASFIYGSIRAIIYTRLIRVLHHDIAYINSKMRLDPGPTPLLVAEVYNNLSLRFKNYLLIKRVEREKRQALKDEGTKN